INYGVFENCENLTSITLPDSVMKIGSHAFYWCKSLISIIIPDSVTEIGNYAFERCKHLEIASVPKHLKGKLNNIFPEHTKIIYR
ncbi:MAG: leucine-rich repeat domain-containing protein, partial [Ruminococcus sp.]|nr:leucine-rich repeat domain-containing protein [Ruminococcus sp.]